MKSASLFLAGALLFILPGQGQVSGPAPSPRAQGISPAAGSSFLGVGVIAITAGRAKELKLNGTLGVEISRVEEGSPAEKAGLKTGDAVLEYNGQRIGGVEQFIRMVHETPAGHHAKLLISRDGSTELLTAVIGFRKRREIPIEVLPQFGPIASPTAVPNFDFPAIEEGTRRSTLGIEIESLTPQLAEYFGVSHGVLVRSVGRSTPAAAAGFRAGDVITKVGGVRINSPSDVFVAIHSPRPNRALSVNVMREHRALVLSPVIPGDSADSGGERAP